MRFAGPPLVELGPPQGVAGIRSETLEVRAQGVCHPGIQSVFERLVPCGQGPLDGAGLQVELHCEGLVEVFVEGIGALLQQLAEQWVGQNDGYGLNKNNYRPYFNPETGLMEILPWDMDYSFLQDYQWGRSWASPTGYISYACRVDPTCNARQQELATVVLDKVAELELAATVERLAALTDAEVRADPRRECTEGQIDAFRSHVRGWVDLRSDEMRGFWGLP